MGDFSKGGVHETDGLKFFEEDAKYFRIFLGEFFLWISLLWCELCLVFLIKL